MPNYDYVCETCGHEWELFQSMNDSPAKSCPKCKKRKARRQIGLGAGIIFKGSGFYETDYRSDSYRKAAESEKKSKESDSSSTSGTPDAPKSGKSDSSGTASSSSDSSE